MPIYSFNNLHTKTPNENFSFSFNFAKPKKQIDT